jgi:HEPN domain-containing protein
MKPSRFLPTDPREWLRRARSNLVHSRAEADEVDPAELCFDAQQAAEKAIKAVFIHRGEAFPYTHGLLPTFHR